MSKPFRIGLQAATPVPGTSWVETAQRAEAAGFSSLLMPDHFGDQLAPVPALAAAAAATSTIKLGALVFGNDYRHPVVLAKEMATLDVLSNGRLELGVGAGWMRTDYEEAGMAYDRPGLRIERLAESLTVMKGLFGEGPFSFEGDHYTITNLDGLPKPVQASPPVIIGGGGKRMLTYAAKNADIVGITANLRSGEIGEDAIADSMGAAYDEKVGWVREAAGDRDIELSCLALTMVVTNDGAATLAGVADMFGVGPEVLAQSPAVLIGSVDEICNTLRERRDRWGFSYPVLPLPDDWDAATEIIGRLTGT